ncbi:hypothetical protein SAMN05444416_11647 [Thermoactinomyces sp. DSM 45892]|nr:hypothetical protein SAMN05444416_11647 [Thermoactinomyces sp. DSM 45892]
MYKKQIVKAFTCGALAVTVIGWGVVSHPMKANAQYSQASDVETIFHSHGALKPEMKIENENIYITKIDKRQVNGRWGKTDKVVAMWSDDLTSYGPVEFHQINNATSITHKEAITKGITLEGTLEASGEVGGKAGIPFVAEGSIKIGSKISGKISNKLGDTTTGIDIGYTSAVFSKFLGIKQDDPNKPYPYKSTKVSRFIEYSVLDVEYVETDSDGWIKKNGVITKLVPLKSVAYVIQQNSYTDHILMKTGKNNPLGDEFYESLVNQYTRK